MPGVKCCKNVCPLYFGKHHLHFPEDCALSNLQAHHEASYHDCWLMPVFASSQLNLLPSSKPRLG